MDLVPDSPATTPNYWQTFGAQNYGREEIAEQQPDATNFEGAQGARAAREYLNEHIVFSEHGWVSQFQPIRRDLYFLFDDGWDVPYGVHPNTQLWRFGSLEVAVDRFPSCSGTPAERLRKLNEWVKKSGWRGAALWVAAQATGESKDGNMLDRRQLEEYWRERVQWSRDAGIEYWKVDWGVRAHDLEFRYMLTEIAKEEAPNLLVEHAYCCGPFNNESGDGRFTSWDNIHRNYLALLKKSDVLRIYDVSPQLSVATMLDRLAHTFVDARVESGRLGIINSEDEVYIGAVLGCSLGVVRSSFWKEIRGLNYDPRCLRKRISEVVRAVRWQRISPCFGAGGSYVLMSDKVLTDSWLYRKGDFWAPWVVEKEVKQHAPAIMARGMNLPEVTASGEIPFVVASRNPKNGAIAVATLPRTSTGKGMYTPLADVSISGEENTPIGVFGHYKSLTIHLARLPENIQIWAQDLAAYRAVDITGRVQFAGSRVTLPGHLIKEICQPSQQADDLSDPGLVILIRSAS